MAIDTPITTHQTTRSRSIVAKTTSFRVSHHRRIPKLNSVAGHPTDPHPATQHPRQESRLGAMTAPDPNGKASGQRKETALVVPSYRGDSLLNLVAELEQRLIGSSPTPTLFPELSDLIPNRQHYLLFLVDGLGEQQLFSHPHSQALQRSHRGTLTSTFPSTTAVALSSVSTGLTPLQHGVLGYLQWFPHLQQVGNLLGWVTIPTGHRIPTDPTRFLPSPNLWERLANQNIPTLIYLPPDLISTPMTPMTKMLYRGAETIPYWTAAEINPAMYMAPEHPTLIIVYTKVVDAAAHQNGQHSTQYAHAIQTVDQLWTQLIRQLPADTTLIGTADHGHTDIYPDGKIRIRIADTQQLRWWGDNRTLMITGPNATRQAAHIATRTGAQPLPTSQLREWLGTGTPHPELEQRLPDITLLAEPGTALTLANSTMIGHHGGATPAEMLIPLLIGP